MNQRVKVWITDCSDRPYLQLQWICPATGRKRTRSAKTADEMEAEARRCDLEADLNAGRHHEPSRLTWLAFRERFEVEHVASLRKNTRLGYRDTFNLFERLARPVTLRGITEQTLSAFAAALRSQRTRGKGAGRIASTVRVHLIHLHTALRWAARQKLILEVPVAPRVKVPRRRPRPVAAELYERLMDQTADSSLRAYLMCGWLAGLRLSEAYNLEWEETEQAPWLDFNRRRIWFPAAAGKNNEDQWIPLCDELAEALDALPRSGGKVFHFPSAYTGQPITTNALSGRIVKLAKRAGVRLSMHSLRKGYGCRYAGKVPAQVLQRLMRHSDIKITMSYYCNIDDAVEEAILGKGN